MSAFKVGFWVLLMAVFGYIVFAYIKIQYFLNNYSYSIKFKRIDSANVNSLLKLGTNDSWIDIYFDVLVENPTDFGITVKDINISFFYESVYIGEGQFPDEIELLRNEVTTIKCKGRLLMNKSTITMLYILKTREEVKMDYEVGLKIGIIPFRVNYKDSFIYSLHDEENKDAA